MALQPNQAPETPPDRRRPHLMEVSNEPPPASLGALLRGARLRGNQDLKAASKFTKIKIDYLEALEEDRLDSLPGRTYAIGFLRTYADFLGLDAAACVARLKAEYPAVTPVDATASGSGLPEIKDELRIPQGTLIIVGVILVAAIFGGIHLFRSANSYMEERSRPAAETPIAPLGPAGVSSTETPGPIINPDLSAVPSAAMTDAAPALVSPTGSTLTPAPATAAPKEPVAEAPAKPVPTPTPAPAKAKAEPAPPAPVATTAPVTPPAPPATEDTTEDAAAGLTPVTGASTTTAATTPPADAPKLEQAVTEAPRTFGAANRTNRVVLRATDTVYVRVETAGARNQVLFEGTLNKGELYYVPAMADVVLMTRNGGALDIFVDGAGKGAAGPAGIALKDYRLDADNLSGR